MYYPAIIFKLMKFTPCTKKTKTWINSIWVGQNTAHIAKYFSASVFLCLTHVIVYISICTNILYPSHVLPVHKLRYLYVNNKDHVKLVLSFETRLLQIN